MQAFVIPQNAVAHFHLREGDRVADFGAGSGHFVFAMARAVGSTGRIFAIDIQKGLLQRIAEEARGKRLTNVEVLWGDIESARGVRIADHSVDSVVLANTLFQLKDKERALTEVGRILRPKGKFFIIDWSDTWGGAGPHPNDIVTEVAARELAEKCGFTFERSLPSGSHHYGLAFRKT